MNTATNTAKKETKMSRIEVLKEQGKASLVKGTWSFTKLDKETGEVKVRSGELNNLYVPTSQVKGGQVANWVLFKKLKEVRSFFSYNGGIEMTIGDFKTTVYKDRSAQPDIAV